MCCGVVPILYGWFLRVPSLHALVFIFVTYSYRDRYWRESTFKGVEMVRSALDEAYGAGKVSLVSAAFRWLNHHSQMKPKHNGEGENLRPPNPSLM